MERMDSHTGGSAADAYEYYTAVPDEHVSGSFQCLDNPSNVAQLMDEVQSSVTSNFVVDFSDDTAWGAFNLPTKSVKALFDADRPDALSTRWINIWYPSQQQSILELFARRYDFSPRLLALMCSDPKAPRSSTRSTIRRQVQKRRLWERASPTFEMVEAGDEQDEISEQSSIASSSVVRGNLYKIASDIWHYSSVDFGRQFVCIGYNSLYGHRTKQSFDEVDDDDSEPLPQCTRVWTWLILCEDSTVISINEDPFPFANNHYTSFQQCILREVRRNLVNVFRSLSSTQTEPLATKNPLLLLPIRTRVHTREETAHRTSDIPGLLFYYLFENWHNSYTLLTRKESRYSTALASLRKEMLTLPTLTHIDRLDRIGKELGVLRRHYAAYARIIDRLLEPISASPASLQNSQVVTESSQASLNTIRPVVMERDSLLGVSLSTAAKVRFKRLRHLIELYALSEVEEYIKQKEAMVSMNFSLIAIKQSVDVDRLTRITLLLTKATFLFLPVSLSTAYFGTQLAGVEYSLQTYWISFGVILFISWLALFMFGVFNGNVQTTEVMKNLWKWVKAGGMWTGRKVKEVARRKR